MINLSEAAHSTIPLSGLDMQVSRVVRHPDTHTADVTVLLRSRGLDWEPGDDGRSTADITVAVASLTGSQEVLASKVERLVLRAPTQDPTHLANLVTPLQLTVRVPRKTQSIRVVTETSTGGRVGAANLDRTALDDAPAMPTPEPQLVRQQPISGQPSGPMVQ